MGQWFMQAEPFLQLFIPNATFFERSYCGGFLCIDVAPLLKFIGSDVVVEWTEAPELSMELDTLTFSFQCHLRGSLAVIFS